jgi:hypothetical protein
LIIVTKHSKPEHPEPIGTEPEPVEAERQASAAGAAVDSGPVDALTEEVEALEALLGVRSTSPTKTNRRHRPPPTDRGEN